MEDLQEAINSRNQKTSIFSKLRFYIVPLAILAIFLGIIFIGVVPGYLDIKDTKATIASKQSELASLQEKLSQIEALKQNEAQVNADLATIAKAFPAGLTSVSEFSLEVENDALDFKLEQSSISSGEDIKDKEKAGFDAQNEVVLQTQSLETNNEGQALFLAIPAKLELTGKFTDFSDYLTKLSGKDKFIYLTNVVFSLPIETQEGTTVKTTNWTKLNKNLSGGVDNKEKWDYTVDIDSYSFTANAFKDEAPPVLVTNSDFSEILSKLK